MSVAGLGQRGPCLRSWRSSHSAIAVCRKTLFQMIKRSNAIGVDAWGECPGSRGTHHVTQFSSLPFSDTNCILPIELLAFTHWSKICPPCRTCMYHIKCNYFWEYCWTVHWLKSLGAPEHSHSLHGHVLNRSKCETNLALLEGTQWCTLWCHDKAYLGEIRTLDHCV